MKKQLDSIEFEVTQTRDGSLVLSCGNKGMESDLVFASGAMSGDPVLERQKEILEYIIKAITFYQVMMRLSNK